MKELSIEQKAKAYDEAKSRISRAYNSNRCTIGFMNEIFPEFEESEDERIRGEMISYFKQINYDNAHTWNGINLNKFVAWLEKQGKETRWKPSKEEMDVLYGLAYISNQYDEHKEEVITRLYQDLKLEFFNGSSYENMFPTNTSKEDDVRRRSTIQVLEYARSLDTYNQYGKADIDKNIAWLEKQSEQKHDKVEPKFNIGDTIINKTTKEQFTINGRSLALQYYHDEDHLHEVRFTEQDDWEIYEPIKQNSTKWGEEDKEIFGYLEDIVNFCYCNQYVVNVQTCEKVRQLVFRLKSSCFQSGWSKDDITRINEIIETLNIVQANRVRTQRMHYNKATIDKNIDWLKSLKDRVQPKQEWSEEDEKMFRSLHNLIYVVRDCDCDSKEKLEFSDWLESLKSRVQPKQEWSEEDEKCIRLSTDIIDSALRAGFCVQLDRDRCVDWLKSIKGKVQPKQEWSEEDEKMWKSALWHVKNSCGNGGKNSGEFEVYNWLKSIKNYLNKVV